MRSLRRPRVVVPTLSSDSACAQELLRLVAEPSRRREIRGLWSRPDVRGALRAMQGWVCAYCLKELSDGEEIEHFRPRASYWWLAYDFSNYFLACHRCNRSDVKGARFPLAPGSAAIPWERRDEIGDERRLLADPAIDPVDAWMVVDMNADSLPVIARGDLGGVADIVTETIRFFQLNSDIELVQDRVRAFASAYDCYERGDSEEIRRRASRYAPQCATYRAFINLVGDIAEPSAEDDLNGLLAKVFDDMKRDRALRAAHGDDSRAMRLREERLWLLAVIAADPPAYDRAEIRRRLDAEGLTAAIDARCQQMEGLSPCRA